MKPLPLKTIAQHMGLSLACDSLVTGFAIDSRKVVPGDLFFALPGARVHGFEFAKEAAQRGAVGIVSERSEPTSLPKIFVPSVLQALQDLARTLLSQRASRVLAITGSLGKTTTKGFLYALLHEQFKVFASPLSYNSQATLPLSILMANGDEDFLILEMGMSQKGEIANLVSIAPPHIALITTVAVQHADNFSDGLEGIARAKAEIFSSPKTRLGWYHREMPFAELAASVGSCMKRSFSLETDRLPLSLPFSMPAHRHNFLAARSVASSLGLTDEQIEQRAAHLTLPPMRMETVEKEGVLFVNDAYNANPDSMRAALESMPSPASGGKKIAVLGDMNALGAYSRQEHEFVKKLALASTDRVFFLGERWGSSDVFSSLSEMECALHHEVQAGDVVLLKGARVHGLEKILERFRIEVCSFSD